MGSHKREPPPSSDTSLNPIPETEEVRTDATVARPSLFPSETGLNPMPRAGLPQDTVIGALNIPPQETVSGALTLPPQVNTTITPAFTDANSTDPRRAEVAFKTMASMPDASRVEPLSEATPIETQPNVSQLQTHLQPALVPARGRSGRQRPNLVPQAVVSEEVTLPPETGRPAAAPSSKVSPANTGFMRALQRRRGLRERPHGMPPWAPEWSIPFFELPRETQLLLGGGTGAVVVTLLFIAITTVRPQAARHVDLAKDPKIGRMYTEAKEAVLEHHYDEAVAALEAIRQLSPDNEEALDYLAFAKHERDARALLDRAKRELEGHRYDEARDAIKQITDDSESSKPGKELALQVDAQQAKDLFDGAEAHLKDGQPDLARTDLAQIAKLDAALAQQLTRDLAGVPTPRAPAGPHRSAATEDAAVATELSTAFQTFNDDPSRAGDQFEQLGRASRNPVVQKRSQTLAAAARVCGKSRASAQGSNDADLLQVAYDRCSEVVADGPLAGDLRQQLLAAYLRETTDAKSSGNRPKAARAYRALLALNPSDAHAHKELQSLVEEAHGIYMNAYVLCDTDPDEAAKRLSEVVGILAPSDPDYPKAKERLDRLRPH